MKRIIFITIVAFIALFTGIYAASAQPDWNGVYAGTLHYADYPDGVWTKIELKDSTCTISTHWTARRNKADTASGKFQRDAANNTFTINNKIVKQFIIEGDILTVLINGKKPTGELAESYILRKADLTLVEKYWKLVELNGVSVENKDNPKEPHIIFNIDHNKFNGNTGCSNFIGSYQIKHPCRISFSEMFYARMECLNRETEELFKNTLDKADSYIVKNDSLTLNRARMAPLARFVAVYKE